MAARKVPQGVARSREPGLTPLRWKHSQKLAGYYDAANHALIYQDAQGKEVDRVDLPSDKKELLPNVIE